MSEGERLERHCCLKKKNKEGSEPRNEATWETRKGWEKSSAQRLQEEHSPVDTGMLAHGDSLQTPSKQNCKEKYEFSLCQAPLSMGFSGKNTGMVAMPSSRGSS